MASTIHSVLSEQVTIEVQNSQCMPGNDYAQILRLVTGTSHTTVFMYVDSHY